MEATSIILMKNVPFRNLNKIDGSAIILKNQLENNVQPSTMDAP